MGVPFVNVLTSLVGPFAPVLELLFCLLELLLDPFNLVVVLHFGFHRLQDRLDAGVLIRVVVFEDHGAPPGLSMSVRLSVYVVASLIKESGRAKRPRCLPRIRRWYGRLRTCPSGRRSGSPGATRLRDRGTGRRPSSG